MSRILVFEPDESLSSQAAQGLTSHGLWVVPCTSRESGFDLLSKQPFHVCLWHCESDEDLAQISRIKILRPSTSIIVISPRTEPSYIVAAIRAGASHFWGMQGEIRELVSQTVETAARTSPLPSGTDENIFPIPEFVGRHPKVLEIFQLVLSIKDTDSTVLITGESGTGKEVIARAIHNLSPRKRAPWVAVNCGAIPASLLESELFGHVRGAFTGAVHNRMGRFQKAGSGTLFLDEISDLPIDLQAKLLRALQQKLFEPVGSPDSQRLEARIIAATNQDLSQAVVEKRFREDLFYRLNVIPISIPPLRARKSDIPLLVKAFLDKFGQHYQRQITGISEEAMGCLTGYQWPGNIRELENFMERVVVLKRNSGLVEVRDLPMDHFKNIRADKFVASVILPEEGLDLNHAVNEFENELILQALQKTAGNKNKAASLLNLNRTTLVEKLKRKGLRLAS